MKIHKVSQGWDIARLEEVAAATRYPIGDGDHGAIKPSCYSKVGIPYIRVADLRDGQISVENMVCIPREIHVANPKSHLFPGDIVISKTGATIGKVAILPDTIPEANTTSSIGKISLNPAKAFNRFVLWYMRSPLFQSDMWRVSHKSAQPGFNIVDLKKFRIPLPPILVQHRIAAILDKVDAARRRQNEVGVHLDNFLNATFSDLFGDPVANSKCWQKKKLGEVAAIQGGLQVTAKRKDGIETPYLRVANVYRDSLDLSEIKTIMATSAELERIKLQGGDVLVVEGHGNPKEIGRCAVWDGSVNPCVHQNHLIRVRLDRRVALPKFISAYLNSAGGRRQLIRAGKTTSGLNTISTSDVRATQVLLPPVNLQEKYVALVEQVQDMKNKWLSQERGLEDLFLVLVQESFRTSWGI